jgi:hypothetical protein
MTSYISYVNLIEFIWVGVNHLTAVYLFGSALYRVFIRKGIEVTFTMILYQYMLIMVFGSFLALLHTLYMAIAWKPGKQRKKRAKIYTVASKKNRPKGKFHVFANFWHIY